jgi:hypothetical protein
MKTRKQMIAALVRIGYPPCHFAQVSTSAIEKFCETRVRPQIKMSELGRVKKFCEENREQFTRCGTTPEKVVRAFIMDKHALTAADFLGQEP